MTAPDVTAPEDPTPPVTTATPYDLLGRYPDRTRPLVTHYDGPESRVELSVATVSNAVAKAASMLRDGLGLGTGVGGQHRPAPALAAAGLGAGGAVGRRHGRSGG